MAEKIDAIYILGCGRSGSTLLDLVLGAHPRVASVGEVWYHSRWAKNNFACTCGSSFDSCVFWQAVGQKLQGAQNRSGVVPERNRHMQLAALWRLLWKKEWHAPLPAREYAADNYALFKAVQEVSGKSVILDSSKNPMRLLYLYASGFFNIKVIHLIRDGRAYLYSTSKSVPKPAQDGQIAPAKSAMRATWHWLLTNTLGGLIRSRLPQASSCVIRYEDFAQAPASVTQRLCEFLNLSYSPELFERSAAVTHNISGSRWRYEAGRAIHLDEKWRKGLPAGRRLFFETFAGWLNRKYGYR